MPFLSMCSNYVFSDVSLKKTQTRGAVSPFIQQLAEQFVKNFQIDVLLTF